MTTAQNTGPYTSAHDMAMYNRAIRRATSLITAAEKTGKTDAAEITRWLTNAQKTGSWLPADETRAEKMQSIMDRAEEIGAGL